MGPVTTRTRGVDYIEAITYSVQQRLLKELRKGHTLMQKTTIDSKPVSKKAAITFPWDCEDLVLDNTHTLRQDYHEECWFFWVRYAFDHGYEMDCTSESERCMETLPRS